MTSEPAHHEVGALRPERAAATFLTHNNRFIIVAVKICQKLMEEIKQPSVACIRTNTGDE